MPDQIMSHVTDSALPESVVAMTYPGRWRPFSSQPCSVTHVDFKESNLRKEFAVQVTTGAAEKYQDLRIVLAHAGGFVPFVADRISMAAPAISKGGLAGADVSDSTVKLLKQFYVDTALSGKAPMPPLPHMQSMEAM